MRFFSAAALLKSGAVFFVSLFIASPAWAQAPSPSALVDIQVVAQSTNQTRLRLTFTPQANSFGSIGTSVTQPAIGFALTSRGNSAASPRQLNGFLRQISFEQLDTVLVMRFLTTGPSQMITSAVDATHVDVTLSDGVEKAVRKAVADNLPPPPPPPPASPVPPADQGYELVMLRYADVSEVVGLLTEGLTVKSNVSFTPKSPGFGSTNNSNNSYVIQQAQNTENNDQPLGQSVDGSIAVDRRLNAVWLKGSPEKIARMKAQIALIDVPVDSVILETQLVELTDSGARSIGINFSNASGQIGVATFQSGASIPLGYTPNGGGHVSHDGGTLMGGHLSSVALQAAIYAQVAKGEGRIVSRPRISALSGSTARIITGDALPILTAITLSGVNGVSQQVQYVNVGVTLQIAPRVTPDGFVSSNVFCVVSSVSGYSQGYPTISQREAQTTAIVRDGDTFVIGGLTQESSIKSRSRVPLLGDLPVVGTAFRYEQASKAKTDLFIVVTPHVVRTGLLKAPPQPEREMEAPPADQSRVPPPPGL